MKRLQIFNQSILKRSYYSNSVIPGLNRNHNFQLQIEVPSDAPAISGYNYVMQRLANTTISLTQKKRTKVLHIFPETSYCLYLGEQKHLELSGLSAYNSQQKFYGVEKYARIVRMIENSATGRFGPKSFDFVAHLLPIFKRADSQLNSSEMVELISPTPVELEDLIEVAASNGYVMFGCPDTVWNSLDMDSKVMDYALDGPKSNIASWKIKYSIDVIVDDLNPVKPEELQTTHDNGIVNYPVITKPDKLNEDLPSLTYKIAIFRKK